MRQKQRGITFLGLIVVGAVLVFGAIVGMQVFPTYIEFLAVEKAAKKSASGSTVAEVRTIFDKAAQIDDITSIAGKDLDIGKQGDKVVVSFSYQREIHLGGPAYLVMKYQGSSR
jgi:hypothetical protein